MTTTAVPRECAVCGGFVDADKADMLYVHLCKPGIANTTNVHAALPVHYECYRIPLRTMKLIARTLKEWL